MIDSDKLAPMLRATPLLGRLVAQGLMDRDEALAALCDSAAAAGVRGDASGWRTELAIALTGYTQQAELALPRAEYAVRDAIDPLLAARPRVPSATIFATAARAADGRLAAGAVRGIVVGRMRRALRSGHV